MKRLKGLGVVDINAMDNSRCIEQAGEKGEELHYDTKESKNCKRVAGILVPRNHLHLAGREESATGNEEMARGVKDIL